MCCSARTNEISRLAPDLRVRNRRVSAGFFVADLIYKSLFNFCLLHDVRFSCAVVSLAMWRHMHMRGLFCTPVGGFRRVEDGHEASLVRIDWQSFLVRSRWYNPSLLKWYTTCGD